MYYVIWLCNSGADDSRKTLNLNPSVSRINRGKNIDILPWFYKTPSANMGHDIQF